jgi:hypothetical protein
MTEGTDATGSLPITAGQLRWVYVAGIALNAVALGLAVRTGEQLIALTLGVVIVYLVVRFRMLGASS